MTAQAHSANTNEKWKDGLIDEPLEKREVSKARESGTELTQATTKQLIPTEKLYADMRARFVKDLEDARLAQIAYLCETDYKASEDVKSWSDLVERGREIHESSRKFYEKTIEDQIKRYEEEKARRSEAEDATHSLLGTITPLAQIIVLLAWRAYGHMEERLTGHMLQLANHFEDCAKKGEIEGMQRMMGSLLAEVLALKQGRVNMEADVAGLRKDTNDLLEQREALFALRNACKRAHSGE